MPKGIHNPNNKVYLLKKSLYELKQAFRQWHSKLLENLKFLGFYQSKNDYSLFIKRNQNQIIIVVVYVDEILVTGSDLHEINRLKKHLDTIFTIKDLGILHYFLGIEVNYIPKGIVLTQSKFAKELLKESGISTFKKVVTPLPMNFKLSTSEGNLLEDPKPYKSLIGNLNFLTNTRPDLAFTVQNLSEFMQSPRTSHWQALTHTQNYVYSTYGQGIVIKGVDHLSLHAYTDSDWAVFPDTRRSVSGYILLLGQSPISWKSKKQNIISKSSAEAEYKAMSNAASEVVWVTRLLHELGLQDLKPITLFCDNKSAMHIAKNMVFHDRTKHIEISCHYTREKKSLKGFLNWLIYLLISSLLMC